ncbi:hypothetical protein AB0F92_20555 [Kitasatospora aureofaciens]|uniref:hypothetical protein n=1 Tax=Kitasatospora aureofaciens TaxID=1894 RepID=UPI00340ED0F0
MTRQEGRPRTLARRWQLTSAEYGELHQFLGHQLHEEAAARMTPGSTGFSGDPLMVGLLAQLMAHMELIEYRDRSLDDRDAGLIDGLGLALRYTATQWRDHPDFRTEWAAPAAQPTELLEYDYR